MRLIYVLLSDKINQLMQDQYCADQEFLMLITLEEYKSCSHKQYSF